MRISNMYFLRLSEPYTVTSSDIIDAVTRIQKSQKDTNHIKIPDTMWNVYLLKCSDGTIYTGCTNDIEDRLRRHNRGEIQYTSTRLPLELISYTAFVDKYKAFNFEKYLKSGSVKAFAMKRLV